MSPFLLEGCQLQSCDAAIPRSAMSKAGTAGTSRLDVPPNQPGCFTSAFQEPCSKLTQEGSLNACWTACQRGD